jgi:hypothetical protein
LNYSIEIPTANHQQTLQELTDMLHHLKVYVVHRLENQEPWAACIALPEHNT